MNLRWRLLCCVVVALLAGPAYAQVLLVAADHSLAPAEYVAKGLPDPTKTWDDVALAKAVQVLQKLAAKDPLLLPRRESRTSGVVFARLMAPLELPADATQATALRQKIAGLSGYAQSLGALPLLYAKPLAGDFFFDAELVETTRAALELNARLLELINRERKLQDPKQVPAWLKQAHRQVTYGGGLTVRGALFIYSARRAFRPEWRTVLMGHLTKWVPALMAQLPETAHAPLLDQLHGLMLEDPKGYADWQELQQLMTFGGHGPPGFDAPRRKRTAHKKKH